MIRAYLGAIEHMTHDLEKGDLVKYKKRAREFFKKGHTDATS
jgi:hypothetical protein